MPKAEIPSLDAEFAELSKAIEADEAKGRKFNFSAGPDVEGESVTPEGDATVEELEKADKAEKSESGPERSEITPEKDEGEDDWEIDPNDPKAKDKEKAKARWKKNWDKLQNEQNAFRGDRDRILKENAELREKFKQQEAQAQKPPDTPADERGFTAEQYEAHATACEEQEDFRSAHLARQHAQKLRSDHMMKTFMSQWQENYNSLTKDNPDLANFQSDFYKEVDETVKGNESFQRSPKGILTAVEHVKLKRQSGLVSDLQAENEKLQKEIIRLNELASPGGGGVNRAPSEGKSFDDMTTDEMYKHLMRVEKEKERQKSF